MRREALTTIAFALLGFTIPALLRFTGALQVKTPARIPMLIFDVGVVFSLGIITTYLIWTRKR